MSREGYFFFLPRKWNSSLGNWTCASDENAQSSVGITPFMTAARMSFPFYFNLWQEVISYCCLVTYLMPYHSAYCNILLYLKPANLLGQLLYFILFFFKGIQAQELNIVEAFNGKSWQWIFLGEHQPSENGNAIMLWYFTRFNPSHGQH